LESQVSSLSESQLGLQEVLGPEETQQEL
jgi:hypothetical protein